MGEAGSGETYQAPIPTIICDHQGHAKPQELTLDGGSTVRFSVSGSRTLATRCRYEADTYDADGANLERWVATLAPGEHDFVWGSHHTELPGDAKIFVVEPVTEGKTGYRLACDYCGDNVSAETKRLHEVVFDALQFAYKARVPTRITLKSLRDMLAR